MAESSQTDSDGKSSTDGFRKYNIPLEQVPRLSFDDPRVDEYIGDMVSIIIYFYLPICFVFPLTSDSFML